jgi:molybdopterin/thiamine biosynthesis adenylyltransferase
VNSATDLKAARSTNYLNRIEFGIQPVGQAGKPVLRARKKVRMSHLFQVGAGSGGMVVLDLLARDERVKKITLIDPDVYKPHNVVRHYFPSADSGQKKVDLATRWLTELRPDLEIVALAIDLLDVECTGSIEDAVKSADFGICAVDAEPAKFQFDSLMRKFGKSWTLGEVLSGGIGGWIHAFKPGESCYGCVASHLQRTIQIAPPATPDYSNPGAAAEEARIPASKASISAIASLHACVTLALLDGTDPGFSSMLLPLRKVDGIFTEAYKPFRFRISRLPECLICGMAGTNLPAGEDLDVALDQALARLGHE